MRLSNGIYFCSDCVKYQCEIEKWKKRCGVLLKELELYKTYCARPKILKEVIHHPAKPRDSQCLYGVNEWDEYVYE